jgi:hypothetical protein
MTKKKSTQLRVEISCTNKLLNKIEMSQLLVGVITKLDDAKKNRKRINERKISQKDKNE